MPNQVLTRRRSWTARIVVLAVVFSLVAVALPASAHSIPISISGPCPASIPSAGFTDIAAFGTEVQLAINCLAAFDITVGTTATTFSPNNTVLRWQMALFLVRQAAVHGITVPAPVPQGYTDIATFPVATQDAINQITQLEISQGTTTTTFSPNDPVTRWQMALFLRRLAGAAGVTVTDDPVHNEFTDIGAFSPEIRAAINFLADGHIAVGTGGSLFSPNDSVFRWAMALFLTRVLAADGVGPPQGILVTVTPTDAVTLGPGNARAFVVTFKNADGTPYTGNVTIKIVDVSSTDAALPTDEAENVFFSSSDIPIVDLQVATGFPGTDGVVNVVIRHDGLAAEEVRVFAWEDSDADLVVDAGEQTGVGGLTTFTAAPAGEADDNFTGDVGVTSTDPANDSFTGVEGDPLVDCGDGVGAPCTFNYDANDIFLIEGAVSTLAAFESALNTGDTVSVVYRSATADVSTFDITDDTDPALTVTDPPAAGKSVDVPPGGTTSVSGTGTPGYIVTIYTDPNDNEVIDAGESPVATTTVATDGTWTVQVPLIQNAPNNFTANQKPTTGSPNGTPVDVPTITEGTAAGVSYMSTELTTSNGNTVLDPGDVITVIFTGDIAGVNDGDTISLLDADGTTATLTCGVAGNVLCTESAPGTLMITIDDVLATTGGSTGGINGSTTIQMITGITAADGGPISNTGDRTFVVT